jgi:hypothetical protein
MIVNCLAAWRCGAGYAWRGAGIVGYKCRSRPKQFRQHEGTTIATHQLPGASEQFLAIGILDVKGSIA